MARVDMATASCRYLVIHVPVSAVRADRGGRGGERGCCGCMCLECLHIETRERVCNHVVLAWEVLCRDCKVMPSSNVE